MAEWGDIIRVNLGDIVPPWRETDIAWKAISEGVQEIFTSDYDGKGNKAIVVIPHRLQAKFTCKCGNAMTIKYYAPTDVLRGHLAHSRPCSCGEFARRNNIGAERDVPLEERAPKKTEKKKKEDGPIQLTFDDFDNEEKTSEFDDEDIID